ncbi:MAG TPA: hypothetical protein VGD45_09735 [Steroidobacter sp.]|uniref:hypothetical protein n=1 Tax=Steroidobacter sp. TaxID=1978227 RepID=UPI002ED8A337
MPFTPFHLGPGAIVKAAAGRHFSFMVYGGTQVLMDIEPLIGIIQQKPILQGYTHTILGALVIGTVAGLIGRPIAAGNPLLGAVSFGSLHIACVVTGALGALVVAARFKSQGRA